MNIKDRILEIVPEAQFAEQGDLTATIPAESFHTLAERLRYDEDAQFDFLLSLTGMDWGETMGVVYHLESTNYGHSIVLKIMTPNRENPELPSVTDLWKTADFNEREVFDFFGIRFINQISFIVKRKFISCIFSNLVGHAKWILRIVIVFTQWIAYPVLAQV